MLEADCSASLFIAEGRIGPSGLMEARIMVAGQSRDTRRSAGFIPTLARVHNFDHKKHDGYLDQYPHDRGQGGAGVKSEQADRRCHGELKEVRGAYER